MANDNRRRPASADTNRDNTKIMWRMNEKKWMENYYALHRYVEVRRRLPQKTVVEGRGLLNWWKYNKKRRKLGALTEEHIRMLDELKAMCSTEHTGGRRKKEPIPQPDDVTPDSGMD